MVCMVSMVSMVWYVSMHKALKANLTESGWREPCPTRLYEETDSQRIRESENT